MLKWKTEKLVNRTKEFMENDIKLDLGTIETMSDHDLHMMRETMKLMKSACELAVEQAEALDEINCKLDKLLEKKEEES